MSNEPYKCNMTDRCEADCPFKRDIRETPLDQYPKVYNDCPHKNWHPGIVAEGRMDDSDLLYEFNKLEKAEARLGVAESAIEYTIVPIDMKDDLLHIKKEIDKLSTALHNRKMRIHEKITERMKQ